MIVRGRAFAGIVQKQAQVKEFGLFEFREQSGEALVPFRFRFLQAMQMLDGKKRVLVDRVAVIEVADDQRFDSLQFRQEQREQAQRIHRAECVGGVRLEQSFLEVEPQFAAARRRGSQRGQRLLNFVFGGRAELEAVLGHEVEEAEKLFGILQCAGCCRKIRPSTTEKSALATLVRQPWNCRYRDDQAAGISSSNCVQTRCTPRTWPK